MAWNQKSIKTQEVYIKNVKKYTKRKRISPDYGCPFVYFILEFFVVDNLRVIIVPTPIPYIESAEDRFFIFKFECLIVAPAHTHSCDFMNKKLRILRLLHAKYYNSRKKYLELDLFPKKLNPNNRCFYSHEFLM